jgi:hypothetical protein
MTGLKLSESFDVAAKIIARDPQFLYDAFLFPSLETAQVFFSTRLEFNTVFHKWGKQIR